jgi:response regulator RpfG family c-di-GMP phosphodiesterase
MLTAKGEKSDPSQGLAEGANDYVIKPFNREELQARVQAGAHAIEIQQAMADELMERRRAEETLRRSQEKYRSLVANALGWTIAAVAVANLAFSERLLSQNWTHELINGIIIAAIVIQVLRL